jgi:hypothetical protein
MAWHRRFTAPRKIGTAKNVSFEKKLNSVRFKISVQKVLKIKKIHHGSG